uniref:Outer capsid protein VP2 n=1 Tax=Palyam virus TaxID=40059 RepID=A0A4P9JFH8_9REOV|nr:VP2 [Palyam virus]
MEDFSICVVKEIPEEHGAQIVAHEIASSEEGRITFDYNREERTRKLAWRKREEKQEDLKRVYNEERTHLREGLYQRRYDIDFIKIWGQAEGEIDRRTYPNYCDLFNIVMRSRDGKQNKPENVGTSYYTKIPTVIQVEESLYTQIRSTKDYKCGKVCIEPYFGITSMDPLFSDYTMQIRVPRHRKNCDPFTGECLYEVALRNYFSIDVPKQRGVGVSYAVEEDSGLRTKVTENGITSRQFQEVERLGEDHPLKKIYNNMLTTFNVDKVLEGMHRYSQDAYGTYQNIESDDDIKRKIGWQVKRLLTSDRREEYDFKKKEKQFVDEWCEKIQSRGATLTKDAEFSVYDGELGKLKENFNREFSFDITTSGERWRAFTTEEKRHGRPVDVRVWLRWMFKVKYVGTTKYYDEPITYLHQSDIETCVSEYRSEWKKRILLVVAAISECEKNCLEVNRSKWYSPVLQACLDLDPTIKAQFVKYFKKELTCGLELIDPTANLGNYGGRASMRVSYVQMKWESDEVRFDAPIRAVNWNVMEENNNFFIKGGFELVSKNSDSYFDDHSVHKFISYGDFKREGRSLLVTWNQDEDWIKPQRFYSYHYRLVREDSKSNTFFGRTIYEVEGRKIPFPFTEFAPHSREYIQESMLIGAARRAAEMPHEKWKWMENEMNRRGVTRRADLDFNRACFVSQWGKGFLYEFTRFVRFIIKRITEPGPHPFFSKYEHDEILTEMGYENIVIQGGSIADCILEGISMIRGSRRVTTDALFYITHAKDKVLAIFEVFPFLRKSCDRKDRMSMYSLNIIPILLFLSPYGSLRMNKVPILIYTENGLRMLPVSVFNVKPSQNMSDWLMYLEAFMSVEAGQVILTEKEEAIQSSFLRFYSSIEVESRFYPETRKYKLEALESWIGVNCLGYYDVFVQMVPIRSPRRGFFFIILGDDLNFKFYVIARLRRVYESVWDSCHGIIFIDMITQQHDSEALKDIHYSKYLKIEGDQEANVWLVRTENSKLGNRHMIAKLMNNIS